jgi:8-oxo-dGTP diphosphatase
MNKHDIHVLARAAIIIENHILLAYDPREIPDHYYEADQPFYYLPGGHIEYKESAFEAVTREVREETGYESRCESFLGVIEHSWGFSGDDRCCHTHEINLIFKVAVPGLTINQPIFQQEEHVAFHWVSLETVNSVDLRPICLKQCLREWLNKPSTSAFQSLMM